MGLFSLDANVEAEGYGPWVKFTNTALLLLKEKKEKRLMAFTREILTTISLCSGYRVLTTTTTVWWQVGNPSERRKKSSCPYIQKSVRLYRVTTGEEMNRQTERQTEKVLTPEHHVTAELATCQDDDESASEEGLRTARRLSSFSRPHSSPKASPHPYLRHSHDSAPHAHTRVPSSFSTSQGFLHPVRLMGTGTASRGKRRRLKEG